WMMPRLPVNRPRCGSAMMSPEGVTRFCSGICQAPPIHHNRHCEPPGRANARPMTGSAKQPISPVKKEWIASSQGLLAMTNLSRAVADRRLERQRGIPGKVNPRVLRHFRNERVDQWLTLRLGVNSCEMGVGHHRTHPPPRLAGIDEVVDDQQPLATTAAQFCHCRRNALKGLQVALPGMVVAGNANGIDDANAKFARNDGRRHQPTTGDRNDGMKRPHLVEPPGQRPAIPVKLIPRDWKGFLRRRSDFLARRHTPTPEQSLTLHSRIANFGTGAR